MELYQVKFKDIDTSGSTDYLIEHINASMWLVCYWDQWNQGFMDRNNDLIPVGSIGRIFQLEKL